MFSSARKTSKLDNTGRPEIVLEHKLVLISFLERHDIHYCNPKYKDAIYVGKDENHDKICKSKYLLFT